MELKFKAIALALSVAVLSGCTAQVNLAARRGAYDSYLDMPSRAEAIYQEKMAYYKQILAATSSPEANPYPALGADFKIMQRHIDAMKSRRQGILDFEKKYDQFAANHTNITEKQTAEWEEFKRIDGEFTPIGQSMQVSLQGFNTAVSEFDNSLLNAHVGKTRIADLEKEIGDFKEEMHGSMESMAGRLQEDHRQLKEAEAQHWDADLIRRKAELLERMEKTFGAAKDSHKNGQQAADAQFGNLPEGDFMWTGPGMEDDGNDLGNLRQAEDSFRGRAREFSDLGRRFEAMRPAPPVPAK